jgi:hypothetical protein
MSVHHCRHSPYRNLVIVVRACLNAGFYSQVSSLPLMLNCKLCCFSLATAQIMEGNKYLLQALGSGLWPIMVLLSEIVQTFILADFW